ncbi:coiled-coil domain-containing protein 30-like [Myxocyprinus asiaticus]|uniref:coiled-coil domain-containing protein 30-like n=1 Tax=Myxocyprinus asiaticus TaxID=70543 RepID=UPI0022222580|nr:coiled-coil domain-containing protein 30-like [Myxocyprinus asiaticus]
MERREEEELEEITLHLHRNGFCPQASAEERECHLLHLLQCSEGSLTVTTEDLQTLRTQQASEMREVENYVEHIRNILEERESLTAEYERDNEQLCAELALLKHQHDSQCKEVVEMLEQEGLAEISQSSASEQVAYLLVERVTLLERLEAAERKLDTQTLTGNLREVHLQEELDHIRHTLEEELRQQKEILQHTKDNMKKAHSEELNRERTERQRLERDLEEASSHLAMAHKEIRHLTDELNLAHKVQNLCVPDLQKTGEEVEQLKQEVDKLKQCDMVALQKTKECNERLDSEIRVLRDRVCTLDTEKRSLLELGVGNNVSPYQSPTEEDEILHKRCHRESEDKDSRLRELERRFQKQQQEHEELVERNEELEALLGEVQNAAKEEQERHECEVEGLQRKIKSIEEELNKRNIQKTVKKDEDWFRETDSVLKNSVQERLMFLEDRLVEEKGWRKQLEVDLSVSQSALKKDKEVMQRDHEELKSLRVEVQRWEAECQQGKTLNKNLTQIKGEKGILEEKVAHLERAQTRLQDNLTFQTENSRAEEDLRESRGQMAELKTVVEKLRTELTRLEKEHSTLRDELMEKRGHVMELQRELSERAHERIQMDGEKERLSLELLHVKQQLQFVRDQIPRPSHGHTANHKPSAGDEGLCQLACVKSEMSKLHSTLEEERQLADQHQLALQSQISEAQVWAKQKGEESKQLRQDLHRTQHLFTSAERELRYEREKNLDLKRHNALLDQEKIKLCVELKQAQAKVAQLEASTAGQVVQLEKLQQRARDLELEVARTSHNKQTNSSFMEELNAERARVIAVDKKVVELQQQLKNTLHQLRLEEARAGETSKLERDTRDMSDNLSALRARLQEEQLQRKLLVQKDEELQQQVRSLWVKEATLTRTNSELSHRTQELETRLQVLDSDLNMAREEQRLNQKTSHRLEEQLQSSQHESERLQEELKLVIQQLDSNIRRYNEKQSQHKIKLCRAKQIFMKKVTQHEHRIQQLKNDLVLASSLSEKEKDWIKTVTEENYQLLLERRELLQRISEAEEMGNNGLRTATTIQQRVKFLEMENNQLQEKILTLANQIGILDRALRNLQSVCTVEEVKKMFPCGAHPDGLLWTSTPCPKPGLCDSWGILDAIRKVKVCESGVKSLEISSPVPVLQSTEIGYLNVTSPVAPNTRLEHEEGLSVTNDET